MEIQVRVHYSKFAHNVLVGVQRVAGIVEEALITDCDEMIRVDRLDECRNLTGPVGDRGRGTVT